MRQCLDNPRPRAIDSLLLCIHRYFFTETFGHYAKRPN